MRGFIQWLEEEGFWVRSTWDIEKNEWGGPGNMVVFPIHKRILGEALTPDESGKLPYTTVILGFVKKTGKSVMAAAILAWAMEEYPSGSELYTLANDLEQAEGIIFQDLAYHTEHKYHIVPKNHRITLPNGTFVQALAHHYRTAAGSRHSVTVWDELWGYNQEGSRKLWAEMTPIPTVKNPLRVIVTYAGFAEDDSPLRDLYEKSVTNGIPVPGLEDITDSSGMPVCYSEKSSRTFTVWHTDPTMPWQTAEYYAEQEASLRPDEFLRLHRNQWVSSKDMFITLDWWKRAVRLVGPADYVPNHPAKGKPLILAVDAGIVHDCSAVVGVYYDQKTGHVGLAFHRIWKPVPGEKLDLEDTVENYILEKNKVFNIIEVAYDPAQLQRSMMTLRKLGMSVFEYTQTPVHMLEMTNTFYDLWKNDMLDVYDDEEFKMHLLRATVERSGRGIQFKKTARNRKGHNFDGAVAMAMASHRALIRGMTLPEGDESIEIPFSDADRFEAWEVDIMKKIPAYLRPPEFDEEKWFDL